MTAPEPGIEALAERVKAALEAAEPAAFVDLLDPNVRWGAPDDLKPPCRNGRVVDIRGFDDRAEALARFGR